MLVTIRFRLTKKKRKEEKKTAVYVLFEIGSQFSGSDASWKATDMQSILETH